MGEVCWAYDINYCPTKCEKPSSNCERIFELKNNGAGIPSSLTKDDLNNYGEED